MELVEGAGTVGDVDRLIERFGEIGTEHGCVITAFDGRYLLGREHVERATRLAARAFERGENVADTRSIEVLLYAAGRRQIDRALEVGVSAGEGPIVVVVDREDGGRSERNERTNGPRTDDREQEAATAVERALDPDFEPTDVLGAYDEDLVRAFFAIGEEELAATDAGLAELVGERVVLLDVEK
jgi:KEOPS complex subunit Cgi121